MFRKLVCLDPEGDNEAERMSTPQETGDRTKGDRPADLPPAEGAWRGCQDGRAITRMLVSENRNLLRQIQLLVLSVSSRRT